MYQLLWLIPAFPFIGFLILSLFGSRLSKSQSASVGVGSVALSALLTILIGVPFISNPPQEAIESVLWTWMSVGQFSVDVAFKLDALTLVFMFVITFVGFLIHLYSSEFMWEEEGYSRFFSYMNLFVGSMLTLVMANNLLLLYLGWEGVGLCSYLLIGFWYKDPSNGYAARKAFVVTRVGDTAMAIGLFLLVVYFNTLHIPTILDQAPEVLQEGGWWTTAIALLLLGGAVGKSAQLPLQTWLPDAMAGPSPVSALIHAATMVTAGVYLIARTHVLFTLAPLAQTIVAVVGALTLLIAGFAALTQRDIKRVLAYSTISQIGYMFLALGVGAWSAAVFHFMTHAFFKALLFLGAGVLIMCLHHEHDMFKMGGLRKKLPLTFWTYLIASASLAALPLVTAGFYSKDLILWEAWSSDKGSLWLWLGGVIGAFITAIYTFRMVFVTFFGKAQMEPDRTPGRRITVPLVILAILSVVGGFVELPATLGGVHLFSDFLGGILPTGGGHHAAITTEFLFQSLAVVMTLLGVYIAYLFYLKKPQLADSTYEASPTLHRFWNVGWGFDWIYEKLFEIPTVWIARINKRDFIDFFVSAIAGISRALHYLLSMTQTGRLRWYAMVIVFGAFLTLTIILFS